MREDPAIGDVFGDSDELSTGRLEGRVRGESEMTNPIESKDATDEGVTVRRGELDAFMPGTSLTLVCGDLALAWDVCIPGTAFVFLPLCCSDLANDRF